MQAIMETLFDAVYLISVITIGLLDVYKRQEQERRRKAKAVQA